MAETSLDKVISELIDQIEHAALGLVDWSDITSAMTSIVPGSMAVFMGFTDRPRPNIMVQSNYPDGSLNSYAEHFGSINPWNAFWADAAPGRVFCSSEVMPSQSFASSEFYNDWLLKLDKRNEGIGMKLGKEGDASAVFSMQIPDQQRLNAELALKPILNGIGDALIRSVTLGQYIQSQIQQAVAGAALIERNDDLAIVTDSELRIIQANQPAEDALRASRNIRSVLGHLHFAHPGPGEWARKSIGQLSRNLPVQNSAFNLKSESGDLAFSIYRLPPNAMTPRFSPFGSGSFLFLVRQSRLAGAQQGPTRIAATFMLSPAEMRMCEQLFHGLSLSSAAEVLGITRETARHRLKQIFQKTGVHRQSALISLMHRME